MNTHCTWTKGRNGEWLVRIPAAWYDCQTENEIDSFEVTKRNGETQQVEIAGVSKPFTSKYDGETYVLGTPKPTKRRSASTTRAHRRCEPCGSTRGVHRTTDMSGIPCEVCWKCDDGYVSIA